ncbi:class II aldolase/adducin family protein [Dysosmobacter sp.]|uniref:class II aldolase/adducin family protein n=1 Tax=Dysosmobacter sp. TaxID=2591382 RepID=UPI003FD87BD4
MTYEAERALMCAVGKLLYDRGYVAANDGNLSMKTAPDRLLVTPSGVSKGRLTPDMLLVTDLEGNVLEGNRHPSSETKMHLAVYRGRLDVGAVVHAHPPVSTAFAVCRRGMETPYLSELVTGLGAVPCTPSFAMLSTDQVPRSVEPYLADHCAVLLANHGALTWGEDLWEAFDRMETVEHTAKILLNARLLGDPVALTQEETAELRSMQGMYRQLRQVREEIP